MAIRISTGLKDKSLIDEKLMKGKSLKIYTGGQPPHADDATTGTLLVTVSDTEDCTCIATGTAGWARLTSQNDGGGSSTSDERVDFAVGTSGTEIIVSTTAFKKGMVIKPGKVGIAAQNFEFSDFSDMYDISAAELIFRYFYLLLEQEKEKVKPPLETVA
jgi:hypothetical protein